MGEDRRTGRGKGGVAIGMIEMPVRIDNPLRHSPEHAGDNVFNLRNAGAITRVNDRSPPAIPQSPSDCPQRPQ
jgi:hypothetical protein